MLSNSHCVAQRKENSTNWGSIFASSQHSFFARNHWKVYSQTKPAWTSPDLYIQTSCQYSHRPWTALGRIHPASTSNELQHFLVGFAGVWHITQREDLPQQYSKWPAGGRTDQEQSWLSHLSSCVTHWTLPVLLFLRLRIPPSIRYISPKNTLCLQYYCCWAPKSESSARMFLFITFIESKYFSSMMLLPSVVH